MNHKLGLFFLLALWGANAGFSQSLSDLNAPIYRDLETWENQGFIRQLPLLKPYSGIILRTLLHEAESKGPASVQAKVNAYQKNYLEPFSVPQFHLSQLSTGSQSGYFGVTKPEFQEHGTIGDIAHFDASLPLFVLHTTASDVSASVVNADRSIFPSNRSTDQNYIIDKTAVTVMGQTIGANTGYQTIVGVGNDVTSFQTGFTRTSFAGYEDDSIVLSPNATIAPHAAFTWKTDWTVFSSLFLALNATSWKGGGGSYPNKYLNFSSLQLRTNDLIEFDIYQSVVYGQRLALEYFLPSVQFLTAEYAGNWDNLFLGAGVRLFFPDNWKLNAQLYLDDFTIMKFLLGDFNTRFKAAIELNLQWSPLDSVVEHFGLDYSLVLPYMYTHNPEFVDGLSSQEYTNVKGGQDEPNYSDYTHGGIGLGSILGPNSDRILVKARWKGPAESIVTTSASFARHANASEGLNTSNTTTGSLTQDKQGTYFDSGYSTNGGSNLFESVRFLDQKTIQYILQSTVGIRFPGLFQGTNLSMELNFTGEWFWNRGLTAGNNGFTPYWFVGCDWQL